MTVVSIATALIVGCSIGAVAALATQGRRSVPVWVLISASVAAALAGVVLAWLVGLDGSGLWFAELLVQASAAVLAVAVPQPRHGAVPLTGTVPGPGPGHAPGTAMSTRNRVMGMG